MVVCALTAVACSSNPCGPDAAPAPCRSDYSESALVDCWPSTTTRYFIHAGGSPQEGRRGSGTLEFATDVGRFEVMDRAAAQGGGLARRRGLRSPPLSLESWGALLGLDGGCFSRRLAHDQH